MSVKEHCRSGGTKRAIGIKNITSKSKKMNQASQQSDENTKSTRDTELMPKDKTGKSRILAFCQLLMKGGLA